MVAKTYRQLHELADATSDQAIIQIAPSATLQHVSIVHGALARGPIFVQVRANIEGLDMVLVEGWMRGYPGGGGGVRWDGALHTGRFEQPTIIVNVRNDSGGAVTWVHQIEVDL